MSHHQIRDIARAVSVVLSFTFAGLLSAKSETVKMTITGSDLPKPVEITDTSILAGFNIWSGPGNFSIENGVKTPLIHDGSILWSQGVYPIRPRHCRPTKFRFMENSRKNG